MSYKKLLVWQKAHALTISVIKTVRTFSHNYLNDIVVKQLLRAVTSIEVNITEGYGRNGSKEYIRFLQIAYGSSCETDNWITILKDSEIISDNVSSGLLIQLDEVQKLLASTIKRVKEKD
jgi:four helix bundle protein